MRLYYNVVSYENKNNVVLYNFVSGTELSV